MEITGQEDQGLGYILGIGNCVPLNIVEDTKIYLEKLFTKRMNKVGFQVTMIIYNIPRCLVEDTLI